MAHQVIVMKDGAILESGSGRPGARCARTSLHAETGGGSAGRLEELGESGMSLIGYDRRGAWRAALACMVTLGGGDGPRALRLHADAADHAARGQAGPPGRRRAGLAQLPGLLPRRAELRGDPAEARRSMVRGGLVATAALLLGMGLLQASASGALLRTAAGVMSAWTFVFASGWGLRRLAETGAPALGGRDLHGAGHRHRGHRAAGWCGRALGIECGVDRLRAACRWS